MKLPELLQHLSSDDEIDIVETWILVTLELVVRHDEENYLIVQQPYYPDPTNPIFVGQWAPPFLGIRIPISHDPPSTVERLAQLIDQEVQQGDYRRHALRLAYMLGIDDPDLVEQNAFTELKYSVRNPGIPKAYHIMRFAVRSPNRRSKANLADPEGNHGFAFLPIDSRSPFLLESSESKRSFAGRALYSNVERLLDDTELQKELNALATAIDHNFFVIRQRSIIVSLDMTSYTKCATYLRQTKANPFFAGDEIRDQWMSSVDQVLSEFCIRAGLRWTQMTGDGILAATPESDNPSEVVTTILTAAKQMTNPIKELNQNVPDPNRVSLRISLHLGEIQYGRVAGPLTPRPTFAGQDLITATRLQESLREYSDVDPTSAPIILVTSDEADDLLEKSVRSDWDGGEPFACTVKDQRVTGHVYRLRPTDE